MNQKPSQEGFFCSSEVQGSEVQLIMKLPLRDPLTSLPPTSTNFNTYWRKSIPMGSEVQGFRGSTD